MTEHSTLNAKVICTRHLVYVRMCARLFVCVCHALQTGTALSIRARSYVVSKHLTHSLASEVTSNSLLAFGSLPSHVCFLGIPAVLCTPVAVLCGVTGHVSLAGHHNLPWGRVPHTLLHWCFRLSCWRCEGHRVVWRALLLRNLYKHIRMRAFMCMCLSLFLSLFSATPCTVIALSLSFLPVSG